MLDAVYTLAICSRCGKETEWEDSLDSAPLCMSCWDSRAGLDTPLARKALATQRAYRENNREKVLATQRAWYENNREKVQVRLERVKLRRN